VPKLVYNCFWEFYGLKILKLEPLRCCNGVFRVFCVQLLFQGVTAEPSRAEEDDDPGRRSDRHGLAMSAMTRPSCIHDG
jgi:hypothetical protein